jgi:hypothetical protein
VGRKKSQAPAVKLPRHSRMTTPPWRPDLCSLPHERHRRHWLCTSH